MEGNPIDVDPSGKKETACQERQRRKKQDIEQTGPSSIIVLLNIFDKS